ncbi:MAG: FAD-binding protein, partial [Candidatus Lokiarchaeota archaeon]|nr:FAD-binding protein [Candidatus Lokiarchaeota archaeon]MBD3343237.1 FAD-binding protein [Candidatus Lokiarchaeota archaeon]
MKQIHLKLSKIKQKKYNSIIIGSGAAGLNCAIHLVKEGINAKNIAILTEGLGGGTSFNTGSDKQTYYKFSITGKDLDSPYTMAEDLARGGAMHGDLALIEATNSVREFFHLIELGVPFPHDKFGGYVGYKTDNDPRQRATSIGPLTSQKMSECLLKEVKQLKIKIIDKTYCFRVIIQRSGGTKKSVGLIALDLNVLNNKENFKNLNDCIVIFYAQNIIMATGGPAFIYKNSVYPPSQKGSTGLAIEAGCVLQNLTESQFGLASLKFRWNLSGSYQQVIPRYYSVDKNGKEIEFLRNYFPTFKDLSKATFLKGYQWPFNAERIENYGSSLIDLAVYYETEILGNKVYLDYTRNPSGFNFDDLDAIVLQYLSNSNALRKTPIQRLEAMNEEAIKVFMRNRINLHKESIQIAVCNQHLNGGVSCNEWWESININHFFAIGEICGTHGIHRPGGAALNSGQVGGLRAALKIAHSADYNRNFNKQQLTSIFKDELILIESEFNSILGGKVTLKNQHLSEKSDNSRLRTILME